MRASARDLVLWFPDWPVATAAGHGSTAESGIRPAAVTRHGRVLACSAAARASGVRRGMRVREAQSACPSLAVTRYDPTADARRFEVVLAAVEEVTPGIRPIRPGLCAVPARGPARFYGGEQEAGRAALSRVSGLTPATPHAGVADGVFAAACAARSSAPGRVRVVPPGREETAAFLSPVPAGALLPAWAAALLRKLGVVTLGDLARLDATAVRDRFGPLVARAHAVAAGVAFDAPPGAPHRDLAVGVDFEPPIDSAEEVTFAFRTAAERFLHDLGEAALLCTVLHVEIRCESGRVFERRWSHPRWFTAADVVDRVRWQLQAPDAAGGGADSPVCRITVRAVEVASAAEHREGLWEAAPDERVHHGLSRVQGLLGHEAVVTGTLTGGRSPAGRQELAAWGDRVPQKAASARMSPWPGAMPAPAPTRLFDPPRPVGLVARDGRAVRVDDRGLIPSAPALLVAAGHPEPGGTDGAPRGEVVAWAGPWPVDERWWDERAARSVYRLQAADDAGRAWLLVLARGEWQVVARYD